MWRACLYDMYLSVSMDISGTRNHTSIRFTQILFSVIYGRSQSFFLWRNICRLCTARRGWLVSWLQGSCHGVSGATRTCAALSESTSSGLWTTWSPPSSFIIFCNCSCLHSDLQPLVDVPFQSPRHSYGIRCHLIFSHLHLYLFSVNA